MIARDLFVVSDIHGHYDELISSLESAGFDENNENHLLIVCGDIFDRGLDSLEVYKYLRRLSSKNKAIILRGNHDTMFTEFLKGEDSWFNFIYNGMKTTFDSFLERTMSFESFIYIDLGLDMTDLDEKELDKIWNKYQDMTRKYILDNNEGILEWFSSLPDYYETKNYIFTHGGIDVTVKDWHKPRYYPINTYKYIKWDALTWDDGSFFGKEITNTDKKVVIGHFGTEQLRKMYPEITKNDKGNDYDILTRDDGKVIALDATTVLSKKVNVLVIEDEII